MNYDYSLFEYYKEQLPYALAYQIAQVVVAVLIILYAVVRSTSQKNINKRNITNIGIVLVLLSIIPDYYTTTTMDVLQKLVAFLRLFVYMGLSIFVIKMFLASRGPHHRIS